MKTKVMFPLGAMCVLLLVLGCGQRDRRTEEKTSDNGNTSLQKNSNGTFADIATESAKDEAGEKSPAAPAKAAEEPALVAPERKFMRTADLRFRTNDVAKTTQKIEEMTRGYGGFVSKSDLQSTVESRNTVAISNDSLLESTIYVFQTNLSLRVPNKYFDTLLVKIQPMIDFLDHRQLTADDVSLSMLTNKMRSQRSRQLAQHLRQAVDKNGKKLNEVANVENVIAETQNDGDAAAINNLNLQDKVDYCTVSLNIYQRQLVQQRMIGDNSRYENYRAPFFRSLWEAITNCWFVFLEVVIALMSLWIWIIIVGAGVFAWRKWRKQ